MAGLVPAIHVLDYGDAKDVDARPKAGHDGGEFPASGLQLFAGKIMHVVVAWA